MCSPSVGHQMHDHDVLVITVPTIQNVGHFPLTAFDVEWCHFQMSTMQINYHMILLKSQTGLKWVVSQKVDLQANIAPENIQLFKKQITQSFSVRMLSWQVLISSLISCARTVPVRCHPCRCSQRRACSPCSLSSQGTGLRQGLRSMILCAILVFLHGFLLFWSKGSLEIKHGFSSKIDRHVFWTSCL